MQLPKRDSLRILTLDELRELSSGEVTSPETYNYRTHRPERHGLYAPEIFGDSDDVRMQADPRRGRFGHLSLATAQAHPLVGGDVERLLVPAPCFRAFAEMPAAWARDEAARRIAELFDAEARGVELFDAASKIVREEGLEEQLRTEEPIWVEPPINAHYRVVVNLSNRLRRFRELGAPDELLAEEEATLAQRTRELFGQLEVWARELGDDVPLAVALRALGVAVA